MNQAKIEDFKRLYSLFFLRHKDDIEKCSEINEALLTTFYNFFGENRLQEMTIDEYCFEKGNKNTFCYWFDYQLNSLCDIHIQHTGAFQKYHIQKIGQDYKFLKKGQKKHKFGTDSNSIFNGVKEEIIKIAKASHNLDLKSINVIKGSDIHESFKAKITYVYSPENWVPILVESDVDNILNWFGINISKFKDLTSKRVELFNVYKKICLSGLSLTTWEFMRFFYDSDGLREILRRNPISTISRKKSAINSTSVGMVFKQTFDSVEVSELSSFETIDESYLESDEISTDEDFERSQRVKKRIGREGENIVYHYLKKNKKLLNISKIEAPCLEGKNNLHYDFSYIENGFKHFIEVKSSSHKSNVIYFELSKSEYQLMMKHLNDDLYEIYFVQNVFGQPIIKVIKPSVFSDKLGVNSYFFNAKFLE